MPNSPAQLVSILSASIAPVIVISGIGLLLLSMTNRFSRVLDLARDLVKELENRSAPGAATPQKSSLGDQLKIIYKRARLLRLAIVFSSLGILFISLTILSLFLELVLRIPEDRISGPSFSLSLLSLLVSLYYFIRDVGMSLDAVKLQIQPHLEGH